MPNQVAPLKGLLFVKVLTFGADENTLQTSENTHLSARKEKKKTFTDEKDWKHNSPD